MVHREKEECTFVYVTEGGEKMSENVKTSKADE